MYLLPCLSTSSPPTRRLLEVSCWMELTGALLALRQCPAQLLSADWCYRVIICAPSHRSSCPPWFLNSPVPSHPKLALPIIPMIFVLLLLLSRTVLFSPQFIHASQNDHLISSPLCCMPCSYPWYSPSEAHQIPNRSSSSSCPWPVPPEVTSPVLHSIGHAFLISLHFLFFFSLSIF